MTEYHELSVILKFFPYPEFKAEFAKNFKDAVRDGKFLATDKNGCKITIPRAEGKGDYHIADFIVANTPTYQEWYGQQVTLFTQRRQGAGERKRGRPRSTLTLTN